MKITITKVIFLALTLILIPTAAEAQTPDGLTPAQETYCDKYSGRAYGICNAWYEAMDCGSSDPTKASQVACEKLWATLDNLGVDTSPSGDSTIPCPCFGDLDTVFNGDTPTCSPADNPTLVSTAGKQVQATASSKDGFNACIKPDGQILFDISFEEATSCVNLIEAFCAGLP
jgi:hypothetical protein